MHIDELITSIQPLNKVVIKKAQERWNLLIKPRGSLGKLEETTSRYAAMLGSPAKTEMQLPQPRILLLWGDTGSFASMEIAMQGKMPVTTVARQVEVKTCPVLITEGTVPEIIEEGAMLTFEYLGEEGARQLLLGSLAAPPEAQVWLAALEENDPLRFLEQLNNPVITAMTGSILQGARNQVPIVLDGLATLLAAAAARKFNPLVLEYCFAGHLPGEAQVEKLLGYLHLEPVLKLGLQDGTGIGAAASLVALDAGVKAYTEMETFKEAGVAEPEVKM